VKLWSPGVSHDEAQVRVVMVTGVRSIGCELENMKLWPCLRTSLLN
jgi:hypothetical protein